MTSHIDHYRYGLVLYPLLSLIKMKQSTARTPTARTLHARANLFKKFIISFKRFFSLYKLTYCAQQFSLDLFCLSSYGLYTNFKCLISLERMFDRTLSSVFWSNPWTWYNTQSLIGYMWPLVNMFSQ